MESYTRKATATKTVLFKLVEKSTGNKKCINDKQNYDYFFVWSKMYNFMFIDTRLLN